MDTQDAVARVLPDPGVRRARFAVTVIFACHGIAWASWTPRIPEVKQALDMTDGELGLALLGAPLGSVLAMLGVGALIAHFGSRAMTRLTIAIYCLLPILIGLAAAPWQLFVALALWGAAQGSLDISMNSQGVAVEKGYGRPILSAFHGYWSVGSFVGVWLGALAAGLDIPLHWQLLAVGLLCLAIAGPTSALLLSAETDRVRSGPRFARPTPLLIALAVIMVAGLLAEGAVADWAPVYLHEWLDTGPIMTGAGYAVFAATMVVGRLTGDRAVAHFGATRVVATLAVVSAVGFGIGLLSANVVLVLIGFGLLGLGLACVVPVVFSAAARSDTAAGPGLAFVATVGWAGFLLGPPAIGGLSMLVTLPVALGSLVVMMFAIAGLSGVLSRGERAD